VVILLNYAIVVTLIVAMGLWVYLTYRGRWRAGLWAAMVGVAVAFGITITTPSYLPKPTMKRVTAPAFEKKDFEMEDRLRPPAQTEEEREHRNKELFDAVEQAKENL
jgi:hypothetical protein